MFEIEAVAEELGGRGGGDDDAEGVGGLDDVEREDEGLTEVGAEAVVGR